MVISCMLTFVCSSHVYSTLCAFAEGCSSHIYFVCFLFCVFRSSLPPVISFFCVLVVPSPSPVFCPTPLSSPPPGGGGWGTVTWSTRNFLLQLTVLLCG